MDNKQVTPKIKILHVEDQEHDADLVARLLRKSDIQIEVNVVDSRIKYEDALYSFAPDIIISDHHLPQFNSIQAMELLKKSGLKIPFVLVTGTVSEEFAVEAMRTGADDYILKDRLQRLPNAVVAVLEKYRANKEQEEAELRIKESEAKYRSFFENSMDGILLTVTDGQILAANPAACVMFRMTEQEICEAGRFGLVDLSDPQLMPLIQHRQNTGQASGEVTFLRKDGSRFPGEISSSVFMDAHGQKQTSMIIRDRTEQRKAEEKLMIASNELKQLNNRLTLATRSAGMSIWDWNIESGNLLWDEGMHQLYKIDENQFGSIYEGWLSRLHPEDKLRVNEEILLAVSGEKEYDTEFRIEWPDQSVRYIKATGVLERDSKGNGIRMIGMNWDITKAKKDEEKIRKSETLLLNIDANSVDMICSISEDGYFLHVSASSEKILGYTPAELIGKRIYDFTYSEDYQKTIDTAKHVMEGNLLTNFENRYVRKDGSLVTLSWSARVDETDRIRYGIARDVTEKNKRDEKIKQAETLLRNIDTNSLDVICTIDQEGRFIYVSSACLKVWGYNSTELVGRKFMDFVFEDDKALTSEMDSSIMDGGSNTSFENRYVRKDGGIVPLLWSSKWDNTERVVYCIAKDATELKQAQKAVAVERKRLYDLFMNAPVSMSIVKGKDHVFELANPIYLQLSGKNDIVGKRGREVFPELEAQGLFRLLDNVYETGMPLIVNEMEIKIDREGTGQLSSLYQNVLQQPYCDADGDVAGIFYFGVDVTEQVLARKKIEESEQRYRQIVETAQEGIWVIDEHDKTTFVNTKLCDLFEYTYEEMIGKDIYFFMDDQQKQIASESMQRRREGKSGKAHFKYISKTKREIWTNVSANPLFDEVGTYKGSLAMIADITEQKKIEEENKKLAYVASLTVNAVIVTDAEGRITWVNQGFERLTEYTFDEVKGKKPGDFLQGKETDLGTVAVMRESIKAKRSFRAELLNYSKYGQKYWLDIEVVPLLDNDNQLTGFMAIEQDITERKRSEQEKLNLITNLQVKNKDLQQFSYIVSHNLRAPVAKILGLTTIIGEDPDENKALIQLITEAVSDLDEVVKDINVIVSSRKSDHEKRVKAFFERKLQQIIQVLEKEINESGATITWDFSEVPQVETIKSYLYSIVYNLVSNAIKYRLPDVPLVVKLRTTQHNEFVCLSVEDNGTGIDLEKNGAKIFGLYKRFNGDAIPGKGVGLNLVKSHAESLGGRVEVESRLGQGSLFKVYFPKSYGTAAN